MNTYNVYIVSLIHCISSAHCDSASAVNQFMVINLPVLVTVNVFLYFPLWTGSPKSIWEIWKNFSSQIVMFTGNWLNRVLSSFHSSRSLRISTTIKQILVLLRYLIRFKLYPLLWLIHPFDHYLCVILYLYCAWLRHLGLWFFLQIVKVTEMYIYVSVLRGL